MSDTPPLDRFMIDLKGVSAAKEELEERMKALSGQISRLVTKIEIDDVHVLAPILSITHDRKMLDKIARALTRIGPLVEEFEKLGRRAHVLEVATEEPGWLAATLGDFSDTFSNESSWDLSELEDDEE